MRKKVILAAALHKLALFENEEEFKKYISFLESRHRAYEILSKKTEKSGEVRVLLKEQYNDNDLL